MEHEIIGRVKNCPLCGSDAQLVKAMDTYLVSCMNKECGLLAHFRGSKGKHEVINRWKRRADEEQ